MIKSGEHHSSGDRHADAAKQPVRRIRDPRLDFFRGIAMLIIFVAHVPWNHWANFIPARFGPSDATEMFVFCSGFAAAIAFGGTFIRAGFWLGTARVVYRVFTLYIAHIMMFLSIALAVYAATEAFPDQDYVSGLALNPFFENPGQQLIGLFTLSYVPNYFDIMPMYIGVLLMMPLVVLAQRIHTALAIGLVLGLYVLQFNQQWDFPAAPFNDELVWFFNPLGWQLLFFTGFALSRKWITPPPVTKAWVTAAVVIVVLGFLVWNRAVWKAFPEVMVLYDVLSNTGAFIGVDLGLLGKTDFGFGRFLHFMALAYLAVAILKGREGILYAPIFNPIRKVGQQALVTFVVSMFISRIAGMILDVIGRDAWQLTLVNLGGMGTLVGVAYFIGWYKTQPWRHVDIHANSAQTHALATGKPVDMEGIDRKDEGKAAADFSPSARPMPAE
ncbi:OpgC family protein [Hwanghaeella sp.]|uniref:OpgC family protein n=1 Tax=Hwanghaeella sp. TaxID=2605943 RepID=UPI003CCBBD15